MSGPGSVWYYDAEHATVIEELEEELRTRESEVGQWFASGLIIGFTLASAIVTVLYLILPR